MQYFATTYCKCHGEHVCQNAHTKHDDNMNDGEDDSEDEDNEEMDNM